MEHIKQILARRAASLFANRSEKGSREWSTFDALRGDQISMFSVATPRKRATPRYPNILHINRLSAHTGYSRQLTPRFAP